MWIIVLFFAIGILLGRLLRAHSSLIRLADQLAMVSILFLLFVLGLSVGLNQEALAHFGTLGLQAAILTSGAVIGSVAAVQLLSLSTRRKR
ncbi:MAG: LysO family transporter [Anaerolineae bacterium]